MANKTKKNIDIFRKEVNEILGNDYVVISDVYLNNCTKVRMFHKLCGQEYLVTPHNIISRKSRCPHCYGAIKRKHSEFVEQIKNIHRDSITILGTYIRSTKSILCKCNICSNEWSANPSNLLKGSTCPKCAVKNAGLLHRKSDKQFKEEVWKIHKTTIEPLEKYNGLTNKILFKCNLCGEKWYRTPDSVIYKERGCPICNMSKGERKIYNCLQEMNIPFAYQKSFNDLKGVGNGLLSYDFYLPNNNVLIEYQGNFHDGTANLQTKYGYYVQQEHDKRKREYAFLNKIELLEIWYFDYDKIEDILREYLYKFV